ncbi:MAG TPA: class I SAM-dependent methyltransferase [Pyrinomonadaceae bacterium]|nr:class I SAM-dependent methyltransferase [Pyrinomonadaceae bacterium]
MGLKFNREKQRNFLASFFYKIDKIVPLSSKSKLKLYLDLEWIMWHLAHDYIYKSNSQNADTETKNNFLIEKIKEDSDILDLGCGRGYVAKTLLEKTSKILGVDYNRASIEHAKKSLSGTGAEFICEDIFDYLSENPERRFDIIVLSHILEHIDAPEDFLNKLVGKADSFYIEVPDIQATHLNVYRKMVGTDLTYNDADHVSEFDREELEAIIRNANLKIMDSEFKWGVMKFWCEKI